MVSVILHYIFSGIITSLGLIVRVCIGNDVDRHCN